MRRTALWTMAALGFAFLAILPISYMRHLRSDVEIGTRSAFGMYLSEGELSLVRWHLDDEVEWSICDAVLYFRSHEFENRTSSEAEPLSPEAASKARWLSQLWTYRPAQKWEWAGRSWGRSFSADIGFSYWCVDAPLWMVSGLFLVWPVAVAARRLASGYRTNLVGTCRHCGYDLRGCMGQICTECGAAKPNPSSAGQRAES